jgi:hypothetical protein
MHADYWLYPKLGIEALWELLLRKYKMQSNESRLNGYGYR